MPRHIEQPARRHSKPARLKTRSSPSASACALHRRRAGDDERVHAVGHLAPRTICAAAADPRCGVGARADEDAVDLDSCTACPAPDPCIRARARPPRARRRRRSRRDPERRRRRRRPAGVGAPRDLRLERRDVDVCTTSYVATVVRVQALHVESRSNAGARPLEIGVRRLVGRDQAGARARLDRHVADRHAPFHGERANGFAGVLDHVAGAAGDAELADRREHQVLGGEPARQRPRIDAHRLRRACGSVCVASTCSTSLVPMPNASAPNAPCVDVWLSPHTIVIPGCVRPSSGPMTWTMPSRPLPVAKRRTPNSSQFVAARRAAASRADR